MSDEGACVYFLKFVQSENAELSIYEKLTWDERSNICTIDSISRITLC